MISRQGTQLNVTRAATVFDISFEQFGQSGFMVTFSESYEHEKSFNARAAVAGPRRGALAVADARSAESVADFDRVCANSGSPDIYVERHKYWSWRSAVSRCEA
jgi:hypothetical protein